MYIGSTGQRGLHHLVQQSNKLIEQELGGSFDAFYIAVVSDATHMFGLASCLLTRLIYAGV